jgi:DNA-binding transcriptional MerR regulator
MKNSFSIGEISELLSIPKSTLRYWESEGLITMPRDSMNNYRKYYPGSVFTISDLAHYRCLRMSLEDMKKLPRMSPYELSDTLATLDQELNQKLKELYTAKEYILKKKQHILEYEELKECQYQQEIPEDDRIYRFSIEDHEAWSVYIRDQYQSILLYHTDKDQIELGLAVPTLEQHPVIWEKDPKASYISFVLKAGYSNPSGDDFIPHVACLEQAGYQVSDIFARYLFSACDDKYYDYYKAFAEVYRSE